MRSNRVIRGALRVARCTELEPSRALRLARKARGFATFDRPSTRDLLNLGATQEEAEALGSRDLTRAVKNELGAAAKLGLRYLHLNDEAFPENVRNLSVPPLVLALRGDAAHLSRPCVSIVGSRRCTAYGESMAYRLAFDLAREGYVIVSGLARGIDSCAHRGALEAGGETIAVMGTGLDQVYPREHRKLARRIIEFGALVSEFPPGTPPLKHHFPQRNRIVVGLSLALVVVEATTKSGTLVSASWATTEDRSILAVPTRVGDPNSEGVLALIRDGATMACSADDVIGEIPEVSRPVREIADEPALRSETQIERDLRADNPAWSDVLAAIPKHEERSIDGLLEAVDHSAEQVCAALFALEVAGFIETRPGQRYRRTPR